MAAEQSGSAERYGPWALVAGGSQGLGAAFASEIARRGVNLVLIARRPGPLEETAAALRAQHGVEVRTASVDLAAPGFLEAAERGRGGIPVMSSLSAFWGSPYVAVYGAMKAFLVNLAEAMWRELGACGCDRAAGEEHRPHVRRLSQTARER